MSNNDTENEEETGWRMGNRVSIGPGSFLAGGHLDAFRPERCPSWEMPLVPVFPMHMGITTIKPPITRRVERMAEKICVLGDCGVGKTSIVKRYVQNRFDDEYLTTCGAKVTLKKMNLRYPDGNLQARLSIQIWDVTGGSQSGLKSAFFRGASGALVVGDAVRLQTQLDLWRWIEAFRAVAGSAPVLIVINKTDIMDRQEFDYLLMDDLSKEFGCLYTMTSARKNDNVDGAFRMLCDILVRRRLIGSWEGAEAC
jgi:small GTP-binding protein